MKKRPISLLAVLVVLAPSGCRQGSPDALGQLIDLPAVYWERARACKEWQDRYGDRECRITLEDIRKRRQSAPGAGS